MVSSRQPRTIRVRTVVAAIVVVGAALVIAAVTLVLVVRTTLVGNVRTASEQRAEEIAATLSAGATPSLAVSAPDEQLIQILDMDGRVVSASDNVTGAPAVARLVSGQTAEVHSRVDEDLFLAVAVAADTPAGQRMVLVARALSDALESTQILLRLLGVGVPLLLVVVGATTWRMVGRALAPVAAISSEVDEISAAQLHRRVPEPDSDDEIAGLARTMNRMLDRLEAARDSQRRFIADASHELRTPIASIRQHAEVTLAHPARASATGLAEPVHAEAMRLQHLVDDLLLLARADEAGLALNYVAVDVDDIAFAEANRLRATTVLRVDTSGVSAGRVTGDLLGLRRMVRNLVDNAARHARSTVAFVLAEDNHAVTLTVDDDGPGIPAADRTRVLQRFVRLTDARARTSGEDGSGEDGSGLGLAIVAELVHAHHGNLVIADSPLGGARFSITLPAAD
jgi:signal transduction histidine kinase